MIRPVLYTTPNISKYATKELIRVDRQDKFSSNSNNETDDSGEYALV